MTSPNRLESAVLTRAISAVETAAVSVMGIDLLAPGATRLLKVFGIYDAWPHRNSSAPTPPTTNCYQVDTHGTPLPARTTRSCRYAYETPHSCASLGGGAAPVVTEKVGSAP